MATVHTDLAAILSRGEWERYEHPVHGPMLTLSLKGKPLVTLYSEIIHPKEITSAPDYDCLAAILAQMGEMAIQLDAAVKELDKAKSRSSP